MTADEPRRQRSVLIPSLFTVAAFCALIGLGVWQLERLAWKEALIASLAKRVSAPPVPLPPRIDWPKLDPAEDEFRRVSLRVQFIAGSEARVYSGGAGLREDIKGPGYFAFAPARLADGAAVVINRGHVTNPNPDASLKPIALPEGPVDLVGALRWPDRPGWFVTPYSERQDLWLVRDPVAMAARYSWGDVAPFYIEQESPVPSGGVPKPGPLTVKLRNDHFGYAMTWFGLAAVLAIMFGFWAVSRAQRRT
jgi:cytochrome oxidase assembly protein ShyY1